MSSAGKIKGIPGAVRNVSSKQKANPLRQSLRNTDAKYSRRKPTYAEMVLDRRANLKVPQDVAPVDVNAGGQHGGDNMAQVVANAGVDNVVPVVVQDGEGAALMDEAEPVMANARAGRWWCVIL